MAALFLGGWINTFAATFLFQIFQIFLSIVCPGFLSFKLDSVYDKIDAFIASTVYTTVFVLVAQMIRSRYAGNMITLNVAYLGYGWHYLVGALVVLTYLLATFVYTITGFGFLQQLFAMLIYLAGGVISFAVAAAITYSKNKVKPSSEHKKIGAEEFATTLEGYTSETPDSTLRQLRASALRTFGMGLVVLSGVYAVALLGVDSFRFSDGIKASYDPYAYEMFFVFLAETGVLLGVWVGMLIYRRCIKQRSVDSASDDAAKINTYRE